MDEGQKVGSGKVAAVYRVGKDAYKVFPRDYPSEWVIAEVMTQQVIKTSTSLNIPSCEYIETSNAIKMDYIDGIELSDRMRKEKYKQGLEDLIDLQLSIYQYIDLELDHAVDAFVQKIKHSNLSNHYKEIALKSLASVESKTNLCHFDMHFSNILFDGFTYSIIDWNNAKLANPVLDIARTYLILKQYVKRMAEKYLREITTKGNIKIEEVRTALPIMACLRLLELDSIPFADTLKEIIEQSS